MPSLFFVVVGAWFCFPTSGYKHVCQSNTFGEGAARTGVRKPGGQEGKGGKGTAKKGERQPGLLCDCLLFPDTWK